MLNRLKNKIVDRLFEPVICLLYHELSQIEIPTNPAIPIDDDGNILEIGDICYLFQPSEPGKITQFRVTIIDFDSYGEKTIPYRAIECLLTYQPNKTVSTGYSDWMLARDIWTHPKKDQKRIGQTTSNTLIYKLMSKIAL